MRKRRPAPRAGRNRRCRPPLRRTLPAVRAPSLRRRGGPGPETPLETRALRSDRRGIPRTACWPVPIQRNRTWKSYSVRWCTRERRLHAERRCTAPVEAEVPRGRGARPCSETAYRLPHWEAWHPHRRGCRAPGRTRWATSTNRPLRWHPPLPKRAAGARRPRRPTPRLPGPQCSETRIQPRAGIDRMRRKPRGRVRRGEV